MLLPKLLLLLISIAAGEIQPKQFYNINEEVPNRDPKILKVIEPFVAKHDFYYTDSSVEEFTPTISTASNLSQKGKYVISNICRSLHQISQVAVLVDDRENVVRDAELYLTQIINNVQSEFWLMKYNTSGVSSVIAKKSNFLNSIDDKRNDLGSSEGGVVFFSILKAVRLLQPGSGILIFTDRKSQDEDLAHLAVQEATSKRIRIFTVWQGLHPTVNNEDKILRDVSLVTHGNVFIGNTEKSIEDLYAALYLENNSKTESIVAREIDVRGEKILHVPIDAGVSRIHLSLAGINKARFTSPHGYLIDLLNVTDVGRFSKGSFVVKVGEIYEIQLNTAQNVPTPAVGMWRLQTDNAFALTYNITVAVQNELILNSHVIDKKGKPNKKLRIDLQGDYTKIENISLINNQGLPVDSKLEYSLKQNGDDEIETFNEKEIDVNLENVPHQATYIQVNGKDKEGNDFRRLTYFNRDFNNNINQQILIEVGAGSQILIGPNRVTSVYFEVTNNKNQRVFLNFQCRDEKSLLRRMQPLGAWLNPQQTSIVTVELQTRPTSGSEYTDLVTFSAISGYERIEKSALVRVTNQNKYDHESPHMWHKFTSDCLKVLWGSCEDGSWTIEVTAQDKETGLLQVTSSPIGLYFPSRYTSGTTQEVTGYMSGSCCESMIHLTAIDLSNNRRTYVADAYKSALGPGAIAAIVLGVLLLIAIIIAIIWLIRRGKCKCGKKESASVDLPSAYYRGPTNSASTTRY